jgi:hypothetical protein
VLLFTDVGQQNYFTALPLAYGAANAGLQSSLGEIGRTCVDAPGNASIFFG